MTLRKIAMSIKDDINEGTAWAILYKKGRTWECTVMYPDLTDGKPDFDSEDFPEIQRILSIDPKASINNGYYMNFGRAGSAVENESAVKIAECLRWHYEEGNYRLADMALITANAFRVGYYARASQKGKELTEDEFPVSIYLEDLACCFQNFGRRYE